jgi:hypothetical protein
MAQGILPDWTKWVGETGSLRRKYFVAVVALAVILKALSVIKFSHLIFAIATVPITFWGLTALLGACLMTLRFAATHPWVGRYIFYHICFCFFLEVWRVETHSEFVAGLACGVKGLIGIIGTCVVSLLGFVDEQTALNHQRAVSDGIARYVANPHYTFSFINVIYLFLFVPFAALYALCDICCTVAGRRFVRQLLAVILGGASAGAAAAYVARKVDRAQSRDDHELNS